MKPIDIAIITAIVLIIGAALAYIIIAKKKGRKCIGCPDSKSCGTNCAGDKVGTYSCGGNCNRCTACRDKDNS